MRYLTSLFTLILMSTAALAANAKMPANALCSVCALKGGETELEKVRAHSQHQGKAYYFCSEECKVEFDADPVAYLPPVFPRPAPAFVIEMLEGGDRSLADFRGKIVLVDFWATWCKPCRETMPRLQKLQSAYAARGFEVLGVSIDEDDNRIKKIGTIAEKLAISYPIFVDAKQTPAWHQFKVKAIPAMYLLDREGQIVAQWTGKIDYEQVEQAVLRRLEPRAEAESP